MEPPLKRMLIIWCMFVVLSVHLVILSEGCNEAVCASIVSKCMLTQSCKCDAKNTSCTKDCFYCLDYLYTECCSCVEMCPKAKNNANFLSQKSHIEDLAEPYPDLFNVLTEDKDHLLRWTTYTYPVTVSFISVEKDIKFVTATTDSASLESMPLNCTVAFMSQCMSWTKCKSSCSSMGASSYRWFHDGCCECVGSTCLNYGINESKCLQCPPDKEDTAVEEQEIQDKDMDKLDGDVSSYIEGDEDDDEEGDETTDENVVTPKEKDDSI